MSHRPWMPLYVADYLADTAHLNITESGAYLHLIMHYWQHGGLPSDDRMLARICKLSLTKWKNIRSKIEPFFDKNWIQKRIEIELVRAKKIEKSTAVQNSNGKTPPQTPPPHSHSPSHSIKKDARAGARGSDNLVLKEAKNGAGPVRIHYNDPQWDAWERYLRKTTGKGSPQDRNFSWIFPSLWPPGHPGVP